MALVTCRECGASVSTKAPVCPTCGARLQFKPPGCLTIFAIVFTIAAIAGIIVELYFQK